VLEQRINAGREVMHQVHLAVKQNTSNALYIETLINQETVMLE